MFVEKNNYEILAKLIEMNFIIVQDFRRFRQIVGLVDKLSRKID